MNALFNSLLNDEAGFIVSAELVLVATIVVLGLIVGLSELALNINNELEDVGTAFSKRTKWMDSKVTKAGPMAVASTTQPTSAPKNSTSINESSNSATHYFVDPSPSQSSQCSHID